MAGGQSTTREGASHVEIDWIASLVELLLLVVRRPREDRLHPVCPERLEVFDGDPDDHYD